MRNHLRYLVLAAAAVLFPSGTHAARPCDSAGASFEFRVGDVRYDGPDPSKGNDLATIAASLQTSGGTPVFECVGQWPEAWAGWFEGGSRPIWGDCIYTGAADAQDDVVAFAADWNTRTIYVAHMFACSDQEGSAGLATGSIELALNCTTTEDGTYCVPESTDAATRPSLSVQTKLVQAPAASVCAADAAQYHGWTVENWRRHIEMKPGASPTDPELDADSGPSFTLRNTASGDVLDCTPGEKRNGTFAGACQSAGADIATTGGFIFDPRLNMLEIAQHWACDDGTVSVEGVGYVQGSCSRVFNSDRFTCTSLPVWIGTGLV